MVFSSLEFLFIFLPLCLITLSFVQNNNKLFNLTLLLFSTYFYIAGEKWYIFILVLSALINYLSGLALEKYESRKTVLVISLICNLGLLIHYKYTGFLVEQLRHLSFDLKDPRIHLPLGISFFTFQSMSYTIDVYRREVKVSKSFLEFFMYISIFPQLVAGPIVRYSDIVDEIKKKNFNFISGVERFVLGLSKKVLIADQVSFYADFYFGVSTNSLNSSTAWLGIICYTIQIYFDFSGYSDMAIGLGRIFGFSFLENFNYPYIATSIQDFWRRWHISLSTWFRDYLYIPLGGNRLGAGRTYFNQFAVFALCGLWHGASWNFVVWGVFHGLILTIEKFFGYHHFLKKFRVVGHLYALLLVMIGWVFFRSDSLTKGLGYLHHLFSFNFKGLEVSNLFYLLLILSVVLATDLPKKLFDKFCLWQRMVFVTLLFVCCALALTIQSQSPFIYFRF